MKPNSIAADICRLLLAASHAALLPTTNQVV